MGDGGGDGGFEWRYDELVGLVVSFITSPGGAMFCRHCSTASAVPAEFLLVVDVREGGSGEQVVQDWRRGVGVMP